MFSLICVWKSGWVNNREAGDLRRNRGHYDVIVMVFTCVKIELTIYIYIYMCGTHLVSSWIVQPNIMRTSCEISLSWMLQNAFDDKSTLVEDNGLVSSGNKPLPEQISTHISVLCRHVVSPGHNELTKTGSNSFSISLSRVTRLRQLNACTCMYFHGKISAYHPIDFDSNLVFIHYSTQVEAGNLYTAKWRIDTTDCYRISVYHISCHIYTINIEVLQLNLTKSVGIC